jgi:hypothetical protein
MAALSIWQTLQTMVGHSAAGAADAVTGGMFLAAGGEIVSGGSGKGQGNLGVRNAPGTELRRWGNMEFQASNRKGMIGTPMQGVSAGELANMRIGAQNRPGKGLIEPRSGWGSYMMTGIGAGTSAYFIYQGYQEQGFKGAFDAAVLDVAAQTAIGRVVYNRSAKGVGALGGLTNINATWKWAGLTHLAVGAGAYQGATIGSMLGDAIGGSTGAAAGAFAGAFAGARIAQRPGRLMLAAAVVGGAYTVGKGAYSLLKTGYRRAQMKRSIDTAGDTSSFFTQNAHTMRARAVQAMHKSHTNARSALGQEASFMHMNRNYFSTYRQQGNMM